jgi:hypothetical protein
MLKHKQYNVHFSRSHGGTGLTHRPHVVAAGPPHRDRLAVDAHVLPTARVRIFIAVALMVMIVGLVLAMLIDS